MPLRRKRSSAPEEGVKTRIRLCECRLSGFPLATASSALHEVAVLSLWVGWNSSYLSTWHPASLSVSTAETAGNSTTTLGEVTTSRVWHGGRDEAAVVASAFGSRLRERTLRRGKRRELAKATRRVEKSRVRARGRRRGVWFQFDREGAAAKSAKPGIKQKLWLISS